jgi:hypothetical protein
MWPFSRKKVQAQARPATPVVKEPPRVSRKAEAVRVLDVLDAPELSVDEGNKTEGFNPYDTGVFDRGKLWESWRNQD